MVPDSRRSPDDRDEHAPAEADGGTPALDEATLYAIVRNAVEDALLSVIGTVLLVGTAFVLVAFGAQAVLGSASVAGAAVGVAIAAVGVYIAAATLELIPPLRDWF